MDTHLEILQTTDGLIHFVAAKIASCLAEATRARGVVSIALSGGSTPRSVYELLCTDEYRIRFDWSCVHFFWSDERCVPPHMPESNFRMANEALIKHMPIPRQNVHRILAERQPQEAARLYEAEIVKIFKLQEGELPEFDILLLGLGEDGHTASLFPGTAVLNETRRIVADVHIETLMVNRITLTLPVINNSTTVLFIVSGKSKAGILQEVLEGEPAKYPAQLVRPTMGKLYWCVDHDAASRLQTASRI